MAAFCEDETMMEAFRNGMDIHASTASKIFKVPLEQVTSDMRRKAKTANFGIIYGISSFGLSQRLNIPKKEAAEIIESYFLQFPAVKKYIEKDSCEILILPISLKEAWPNAMPSMPPYKVQRPISSKLRWSIFIVG